MQMISNLYSRDGFPLPQVQSLRLSLLTLPSPFPSPSNPRYLYRTPPPSNHRTLESICGSCVRQLSGWSRAVYCAWH
jgi:hypothetical protein